jgi:hypothetical protein
MEIQAESAMALPYYMVRLSIVTLSIIQIIDFEEDVNKMNPFSKIRKGGSCSHPLLCKSITICSLL